VGVGRGVGVGVGRGVGVGAPSIDTVGPVAEPVEPVTSAASKVVAQVPAGSVVDAANLTPRFQFWDVDVATIPYVDPATRTLT
jgi:hypothetical protein